MARFTVRYVTGTSKHDKQYWLKSVRADNFADAERTSYQQTRHLPTARIVSLTIEEED